MHEVSDITQLSSLMLDVQGQVQGVGFRPFLYRLASRHLLRGEIYNHTEGAGALLEGTLSDLENFKQDFENEVKEPIIIEKLTYLKAEFYGFDELKIRTDKNIFNTPHTNTRILNIQPDTSTCPHCWKDYFDQTSRFFGYAFTTCSDCGPRWTISKKFPFERENTTYKNFTLCDECRSDYQTPTNRRFHAQTISCPKCGPQLQLLGPLPQKNITAQVAELITAGAVGVIKGMGGYQLICDANNADAVRRLRKLKKRPHQPLAVMFRDEFVFMKHGGSLTDWQSLTNPQAPIACLKNIRLPTQNEISPDVNETGCMAPTTTLHHAVMPASGLLVVTSCNKHSLPIAGRLDEIPFKLSGEIDFILDHDRDIEFTVDDSVIREKLLLRAARGFTPKIHQSEIEFKTPVIALGADLKNSTALGYANFLIELPYNGTLSDIEGTERIKKQLAKQLELLKVKPEMILCDRHPETLSRELYFDPKIQTIQIPHHAAHASAVLKYENSLVLTFDGTGINHDNEVNGGEGFLSTDSGLTHVLSMSGMPMTVGDSGIKHPWKTLVSALALTRYEKDKIFKLLPGLNQNEICVIYDLATKKNTLMCTSFGRWFDSCASLIYFKNLESTYEAQAPIVLEALAAQSNYYNEFKAAGLRENLISTSVEDFIYETVDPTNEIMIKINGIKMLSHLADLFLYSDTKQQKEFAFLSHLLAAKVTSYAVTELQKFKSFKSVIGTGGVFQNKVFTALLNAELLKHDVPFFVPKFQSINDQSIALGQLKFFAREHGESNA